MAILETNTIFSKGDYIFGTNSILLFTICKLDRPCYDAFQMESSGKFVLSIFDFNFFCQCFEISFLTGPEKLI